MRQFIIPTRYTNLISGVFYEFPPDSREINKSFLDIILVHAFPFDSGMYKENFKDQSFTNKLNEFAKKNGKVRVFLPDMPGFGLSEPFDNAPENLIKYVNVIDDLKNYFKIENLIIGGCSMGGYICLEYAFQYPMNLNGLILIDTTTQADTTKQKKIRKETNQKIKNAFDSFNNGDPTKLKIDAIYLKYPEIQQFIDELHSKIVSPEIIQKNREIGSKILSLMKRQSLTGIMHALQAMAGRNDRSDIIKKFNNNILIIVGERDEITPINIAQKMNKKAKNSELKIIPSAGHLSNIDKSSFFNDILIEWLNLNY